MGGEGEGRGVEGRGGDGGGSSNPRLPLGVELLRLVDVDAHHRVEGVALGQLYFSVPRMNASFGSAPSPHSAPGSSRSRGRARGSRLTSAPPDQVVSESDSIITARPSPATAPAPRRPRRRGGWGARSLEDARVGRVAEAEFLDGRVGHRRRQRAPAASAPAMMRWRRRLQRDGELLIGGEHHRLHHRAGSRLHLDHPIAFLVGSIVIPNVSSPAHTASRSTRRSRRCRRRRQRVALPLELDQVRAEVLAHPLDEDGARELCVGVAVGRRRRHRQSEVPHSPTRPVGGERVGGGHGGRVRRRGGAGAHRSSC